MQVLRTEVFPRRSFRQSSYGTDSYAKTYVASSFLILSLILPLSKPKKVALEATFRGICATVTEKVIVRSSRGRHFSRLPFFSDPDMLDAKSGLTYLQEY